MSCSRRPAGAAGGRRSHSLRHFKMDPTDTDYVESFVRATGGGKGSFDTQVDQDRQAGKIYKFFNQKEKCKLPEGNKYFGDCKAFGLGFGRIKFRQNNDPKPYIRVPWQNDDRFKNYHEMLLYFVENVWGLELPNLVVSITGAATDSLKNSDDLQLFLQDLMGFARRTNAWITTGGTCGGIMKLIGWSSE